MCSVNSHGDAQQRKGAWHKAWTWLAAWEHPERWVILLVILVATVLRLAALPNLPLGLHYDEAANLILSREIAEGATRPLFIRAYTGKEVLFFYTVAPWVAMTGGRAWGLRLGAAILGVLTVAATYSATRALFRPRAGSRQLALFAAGWMALAFPHVLLSRYGFRAISQPLLQALTIAALWRGLRGAKLTTGNLSQLLLGGLCLGLTGYTYLAARLFPIPLALAIAWLLINAAPPLRQRYLGRLMIAGVVAGAAFAPLGLLYLREPDLFSVRVAQVVAPTLKDAARGVALCLQALLWPGRGDPYVRFNVPGRPVMDGLSAFLALVGVVSIVVARRKDALDAAGRLLVGVAVAVMILPSALATAEVTPSNLRLIGIYPFLAMLPAWGLLELLRPLARFRVAVFLALLLAGAFSSGSAYRAWAGSEALFQVTDGEMVWAAQALDALPEGSAAPTVYIASDHYRHPTVAALAARYAEAKWLTGGSTLVLPAEGAAAYLIPNSLTPPMPWPEEVTGVWNSHMVPGPGGAPALTVHMLTGSEVAALREKFTGEPGADEVHDPADFAHVVLLHSAKPGRLCRVAEPCPIVLVWEPRVVYPSLQPIVRLLHPETGEWDRVMPFHYASGDWTPGEIVLDQLPVTPPVGTPPGAGYQISVGFYDPAQGTALPRLQDESFAGLEARFPQTAAGYTIAPIAEVPAVGQMAHACSGVRGGTRIAFDGIALLGWSVTPGGSLLPGSEVRVRMCWQATATAPPHHTVRLQLRHGEHILYSGEPAAGYGLDMWREGEVVEGVYRVRLPRSLQAGAYDLSLQFGNAPERVLETFAVGPLTRTFEVPPMGRRIDEDFADATGDKVRLLGYDFVEASSPGAWTVTLHWLSLEELEEDYVVFVHARDPLDGTPLTQTDQMPRGGTNPTSRWIAGEVVSDMHTLVFAQPVPEASALFVGLYLPEPGTHLTVQGATRLRLDEVSLTR
jgi:hypothetical protein